MKTYKCVIRVSHDKSTMRFFSVFAIATLFGHASAAVVRDIKDESWFDDWGNVGTSAKENDNLVMTGINYQGMQSSEGYSSTSAASEYLHIEYSAALNADDILATPIELNVYAIKTDETESAVTLCLSGLEGDTQSVDVPLSLFVSGSNSIDMNNQIKFEILEKGSQKALDGIVTVSELSIDDAVTTGAVLVSSLQDQICKITETHLVNYPEGRDISLDDPYDQSTFNNAWQYGDEEHQAKTFSQGRLKNHYIVTATNPTSMKAGFAFRDICYGLTDEQCNELYLRKALYPLAFDAQSKITFDAKIISGTNRIKFAFEEFQGSSNNVETGFLELTSDLTEYELSIPSSLSNGEFVVFNQMILYLESYDSEVLVENVRLHDVGGRAFECDAGSRLVDVSCVANVCQCTGGNVDTSVTCLEHGAELCGSCKEGFRKVGNECVANVCQCANGDVDTSVTATCLEHGAELCKTCNAGFRKVGDECVANVCQCTGGNVDTSVTCLDHGARLCGSCVEGFRKVENECITNVCQCTNGNVDASAMCLENGAQLCGSCDSGTILDGTVCLAESLESKVFCSDCAAGETCVRAFSTHADGYFVLGEHTCYSDGSSGGSSGGSCDSCANGLKQCSSDDLSIVEDKYKSLQVQQRCV